MRCRVNGAPVHVVQSGCTIRNVAEAGDFFFGIRTGAANTDTRVTDSLGTQMLLLRDCAVAEHRLVVDPDNRGILTLAEAIESGVRFFHAAAVLASARAMLLQVLQQGHNAPWHR